MLRCVCCVVSCLQYSHRDRDCLSGERTRIVYGNTMGRLRETTGDYGQTTGKLRGISSRMVQLNSDCIRCFSITILWQRNLNPTTWETSETHVLRSEVSPLEASGRIKHIEQRSVPIFSPHGRAHRTSREGGIRYVSQSEGLKGKS